MEHAENSEALLMRYLLGQLSESEQERVEHAYIADEAWQEQLAMAEDDLIDDYVRGKLAEDDRAAFEKHFLNSLRRRERVAFARAWQQFAAALPPVLPVEVRPPAQLRGYPDRQIAEVGPLEAQPQPGSRRSSRTATMLLLAATVLLLIGSAWLLVEITRLRKELAHSQADYAALAQSEEQLRQQVDAERARNEALLQQRVELPVNPQSQEQHEPDQPVSQLRPPVVVSFVLTAGLSRDVGEKQTLTMPSTAQQVRLQLLFRERAASQPPNPPHGPGQNKSSYRAVLRTTEGREVLRHDGLKAQRKGAGRIVVLPAASLASRDYILTLERLNVMNDSEVVAEYAFVIRK